MLVRTYVLYIILVEIPLCKEKYETIVKLHMYVCMLHVHLYSTCNSCNMDTRALPDMHSRQPEAEGFLAYIHIKQNPEYSMLQLICDTSHPYQADSLHRATIHPSMSDILRMYA